MKTQYQLHRVLSHGFSVIGILLLLIITTSIPVFAQVTAQTGAQLLYLPVVTNIITNANNITIKTIRCLPNENEAKFAELLSNDPGQKRAWLICNPLLAQVAHERAMDMALRAYISHVNPDGYGPNYLVRQSGYVLPDYYGKAPTDNNIESIAAGYSSADEAWAGLLNSAPHRSHVLGTDKFYAAQTEYGIGCVQLDSSPYGYYWVIITAKPGP